MELTLLMKKIILFNLLFLLVLSSNLFAGDVVVLIKGKVIDDATGKPIGTSFAFKSTKDNRIPVKSNRIGGEYQQVLKSGKKYAVYFDGYRMNSFSAFVEVPNTSEYIEIEKDFHIVPIKKNDEVYKISLFKSNDTLLSEEGTEFLSVIKDYLAFQKNVNVDLIINTRDSKFKPSKRTIPAKGKTKAKVQTVTPQVQAIELGNARVSLLKEKFKEHGIRVSGVNFVTDKTMTAPKPKKTKNNVNLQLNQEPNVLIIVSGVKSL